MLRKIKRTIKKKEKGNERNQNKSVDETERCNARVKYSFMCTSPPSGRGGGGCRIEGKPRSVQPESEAGPRRTLTTLQDDHDINLEKKKLH